MPAQTLFTLSSARSGTRYLADFFKKNVKNCYSTHEPYFSAGNPVLFGEPIAWYTQGNDERLLALLKKKHDFIVSKQKQHYFEANHALVKVGLEHWHALFPEAKYIHLLRNPIKVAKSEMHREQLIAATHLPFTYYRSSLSSDKLFKWSLTGYEPLFTFVAMKLGHEVIQHKQLAFYITQWFEIEYRITQFLHGQIDYRNTFLIDIDKHMNSSARLEAMAGQFGLKLADQLNLDISHHKTPFAKSSQPDDDDIALFQRVFRALPPHYQAIFSQYPYQDCEWIHWLEE